MVTKDNQVNDILVFKTNIRYKKDLKSIADFLDGNVNIIRWNIDRGDTDKVLRVECRLLRAEDIICLLQRAGYECEELPD